MAGTREGDPAGRTRLSAARGRERVLLPIGGSKRRIDLILCITQLQFLPVDLQEFAKRQEQAVYRAEIAVYTGLHLPIDPGAVTDQLPLLVEQIDIFLAIEPGDNGGVCPKAIYL